VAVRRHPHARRVEPGRGAGRLVNFVTEVATQPLTIVPSSVTDSESRSFEGRFLGASYKAERVRRLRADSQPAPGRLRASFTPVLRPVREMQSLDWDRKGRVTPAWTASQEAWPGAEPGGHSPGESRSGAPEGERAPTFGALPRPAHRQAVTLTGVARTLVGCASRRSAPLFLAHDRARRGKRIKRALLLWWLANLGRRARRENGFAYPPPRSETERGRGTMRSMVEGASGSDE
jgi:hypothetical protein